MKLLALDSATAACSAACWSQGEVVAQSVETCSGRQAEILMPMVRRVMREAALDYEALDLIAVTSGPGSFTGVRIGLATARGLALAAGLPLAGITTLQALAAAPPEEERRGRIILAALDARRGQIYAQFFDQEGAALAEAFAAAAESLPTRLAQLGGGEAGEILLVGSGAELAAQALDGHARRLSASPPHPQAAVIAAYMGARDFDASGAATVAPFYLREPGVGTVRRGPAGA
jgi:tRNA threonylcarbamoyladenosine biosynthesis protein TsaB